MAAGTLKGIFEKHRESLLYLFFGGLTTAVNYIVYVVCYRLLPFGATTLPNLIAWLISVLFAYATNRRWVFQSTARGAREKAGELLSFAGARVLTLLLETALLWLVVDLLQGPNLITKLLVNLLVIALNYVLSKFFVFKKREGSVDRTSEMEE